MPRALQSLQKMKQMKRHMTVLSILAFLVASSAQGKESRCDVFPTDYCAQNITITIEKRHVELRKSLTLHNGLQGMKDPVVMLNYVGDYTCETSEGYVCSKVTEDIFFIITPCAESDSFRLSVDGEQDISCVPSQQKSQPFEQDAGRPKSEDSDLQKNSLQASKHKEVTIGLIVGISIAVLIVIVSVTTFVLKRRRMQSKRQNIPRDEERNQFIANSKDLLTSSSSEGRKSNS